MRDAQAVVSAAALRVQGWDGLDGLVTERLGLHFPRARARELRSRFDRAAAELGAGDSAACARALLAQPVSPASLEVLARHLCVGETYFFRDPAALEALSARILAPLIEQRRSQGRWLRAWSAGCSTGEEAYTLAIILHRLLPDVDQWRVSVMGTDVNADAIRQARCATYGDWSFRNAPAWLKSSYFEPAPDGRRTVRPEIRRMVRFSTANLVDVGAPGTAAMDLILCRNVLMYFSSSQARRVTGHLFDQLSSTGWLLTSPAEAAIPTDCGFEPVQLPGALLHRKPVPARLPPDTEAVSAAAQPGQRPQAAPAAPSAWKAHAPPPAPIDEPAHDGTARFLPDPAHTLADRGQLPEALQWCDRCLAADRLNTAARHLRAMVLIEMGDTEAAQAELRRVLYLDPDSVMARLALVKLVQQGGTRASTRHHLQAAERVLTRLGPSDPVPHSNGLTATDVASALRLLMSREAAS